MSEIRFVYFDLGNVLVAFDRMVACRQVCRLFGDADTSLADRVLHDSGLQSRLESGQISESEYCEIVREQFAESLPDREVSPVDDAEILRAISDMFTPIECMRDVLDDLRDKAMPIGILSNTCAAHWNWVQSQSYRVLTGHFDAQVVSHEVACMKPDPLIYTVAAQKALDCCGAEPDQILFLDDREENVVAAREHGWRSEVCVGGEPAVAVLRNFGLLTPNRVT